MKPVKSLLVASGLDQKVKMLANTRISQNHSPRSLKANEPKNVASPLLDPLPDSYVNAGSGRGQSRCRDGDHTAQ
jgi:hypothetical protein